MAGSATNHRYRRGTTVPALFGAAVRQFPDAVALVHRGAAMTYRQLDARSDEWAAELEDRGIGHGAFVPVLLDRTPETVAALLGILKRGAAYAALDPRWPTQRKAALVTQLSADLVVTDEPGWRIPTIADAPHNGRRPSITPIAGSDPCAVFFTSGSTGTPKGAVIPHYGPARLFDDCQYGEYGPGSVLVQMFPLLWDGPILDLWGPLCCGGTAVMVDEVLQPALLRALVAEHGVNASCMPTAVFNMIADEDIGAFAGFRWIVTGSEKVSASHIGRVLRAHPGIVISNGYGPVESAGLVSTHRITPADLADPNGIPIGRALTDSAVHVLDGERVCAAGEVGEICLAGPGLALWYLGDPALTARKFVTVRIDGAARRVYRTGDLGCIDQCGVLHYRGRNDWQIKIRGHRIEPGEVEHHADQLPGVLRSAVLANRGADGLHKALHMWYVPDPLAPAGVAEVRAALATKLPGFLVPGDITIMATLPLTQNGKLDRVALRSLLPDVAERGAGELPNERPEEVISAAFAQLLDTECTPEDGFFALGGSSLDAARLCARVGATLGVTIPVSQFYRTPTVAGLAEWLAAQSGVDVQPVVSATPRPGAGQLAYLDAPAGFICLLSWYLDGTVDLESLRTALADLHRRHQTLRAHYRRTEPPTVLVEEPPGEPEIHVLGDEPSAQRQLCAPLDITTGHVWRGVLVPDIGDGRVLLGLGLHHIAFDGWSESLLIADLRLAYAARIAGREPVWPRSAPTMAELAAEQDRYTAAVDLGAQTEFWQRELRGLRGLRLPGVRPGPTPQAGPIEHRLFELPAERIAKWDEFARTKGCTRFPYLVAIFAELLGELSGAREVGMLLPVANRGGAALEQAIVSRMDAVCLRLRSVAPAASALGDVTEAIHAALAAQDLPLRELFADLARRRPDVHALLNLPVFLLHDHERASLTLPGCAVELATARMAADQAGPLAVEVLPTGLGATLRVTVRTDRAPIELAETVGERFVHILTTGPVTG